MDNASKALIMAGGVLIAILIISLALYMLSSVREVANASEERYTASQIEAFNRFFLSYPSEIRGVDAYNIVGKIDDINNDESSIIPAPSYDDYDGKREYFNALVDDGTLMMPRLIYIYNYYVSFGPNGAVNDITITNEHRPSM